MEKFGDEQDIAEQLGIAETRGRLAAVLTGDDELGMILRGHAMIERELDGLLTACFNYPEHLFKASFGFSQKVRLAQAIGLRDEIASALLRTAEIRNKFAHSADAIITEEDAKRLYDAFGQDRKIVTNSLRAIELDQTTNGKTAFFEKSPKDKITLLLMTAWSGTAVARIQIEGRMASLESET